MENNKANNDEYLQDLISQLNLENAQKEEKRKAEEFARQFIAEVDSKL